MSYTEHGFETEDPDVNLRRTTVGEMKQTRVEVTDTTVFSDKVTVFVMKKKDKVNYAKTISFCWNNFLWE